MNSRRLDYDYKLSQLEKGKGTEDELFQAEDKFNESMQNTDVGMKKFAQNEVHSLLRYFEQSSTLLMNNSNSLIIIFHSSIIYDVALN